MAITPIALATGPVMESATAVSLSSQGMAPPPPEAQAG